MKLVRAAPPMFDEIAAKFDVRGKPVLFAWGDTIYAPVGVSVVAPQLQAHEGVHGERQLAMGVETWWRKYLDDAEFRLREEKLGHLAEYDWHCRNTSGRSERRRHLSNVAGRLSASLYRYSITKGEAREFLKMVHGDGHF